MCDRQKITAAIQAEPSVTRLIHLRTQHIGPGELLVGAKLQLAPDLSIDEAVETVNRVEANVRRAVATVDIMYVEPDTLHSAARHGGAPLSPGVALGNVSATDAEPARGAANEPAADGPGEDPGAGR